MAILMQLTHHRALLIKKKKKNSNSYHTTFNFKEKSVYIAHAHYINFFSFFQNHDYIKHPSTATTTKHATNHRAGDM